MQIDYEISEKDYVHGELLAMKPDDQDLRRTTLPLNPGTLIRSMSP
jgi:hypothetical protein